MTPIEAARWYITTFRIQPVPIPHRKKKPVLEEWQKLEITLENADQYFNGVQMNIGARLGDPFNLADVDIDAPEAHWAWQEFALETYFVFGHQSKPASHCFYFPDEEVRTDQYKDPCAGENDDACLIELRSRKTDGTFGLQTVVPPSIHESGERIEFTGGVAGEPGKVVKAELERAVRLTAACALLGRHAPAKGTRHDYFLSLAGSLARARWPIETAKRIVRAVYRVIWHEKAILSDADKDVESTYQRHEQGGQTTGTPHLKDLLEARVFARAAEWLALGKAGNESKKEFKLPKGYNMQEVLAAQIPRPEQLIEDLLPRKGATLLYGAQKSGKTLFAVQTAIAIATGTALFQNFRIRRPGAVMILEQDDPDGIASLRDIYLKAHVPRDCPIHTFGKQDAFYLGSQMMEWLEARIQELNLVLVILDSYTALRAPHPPGVDIVKHENAELTLIDELGKRRDCCFELLHHASKGAAGLDWASKAGGTFAMTMAMESQIHVERYDQLPMNARERHVRTQGRHLASREMTLRFDEAIMGYELILEGPAADIYPLVQQIQYEFKDGAFNAKLLAAATGMSRATAYRHLGTLLKSEAVIRTEGGDYVLIPSLARPSAPKTAEGIQ